MSSVQENLDLNEVLEFAHFRNACKTSRFYSCAIDCFLELGYRIFLPEILSRIEYCDLSQFFNLMHIAGMTEIEYDPNCDLLNNAFNFLDEIREPIWRRVIESCESFRARNSDAVFSDIFSSNFFKTLSQQEQQIFETKINSKGICHQCHVEKEYESTELVNFILDVEYPELLAHENDWTKALESVGSQSGTCDSCYTAIPANLYSDVNLPVFFLVDFSREMINSCCF